MRRKPIMAGDKFGHWTVILAASPRASADGRHRIRYWATRCECGSEWEVRDASLKNGSSTSCGCFGAAGASARFRKHGQYGTPEYHAWGQLIARCTSPDHPSYPDYGGRGITVCDRWRESFANFLADMGPRPSSKHSIDRVDVNGNYEPGNCRWATAKEQARNKRTSRMLTAFGITRCLSDWADVSGIGAKTLEGRLRRGWSVDRAVTAPADAAYRHR